MNVFMVTEKVENNFFCYSSNSTTSKSKKRKSLVISNPIPCNTAFPADHVSLHSSTQNGKDAVPTSPVQRTESISEESNPTDKSSVASKDVSSSDSDLSSSGTNTPHRQSVCDNENSDRSTGSESPEHAEAAAETEAEHAATQSDDSGVGVPKSEAANQDVTSPSNSADSDALQSPDQDTASDPTPPEEVKTNPAPVPAPRQSFHSTDKPPLLAAKEQDEMEEGTQETTESGDDASPHNPPGFLYKVHNSALKWQHLMSI